MRGLPEQGLSPAPGPANGPVEPLPLQPGTNMPQRPSEGDEEEPPPASPSQQEAASNTHIEPP